MDNVHVKLFMILLFLQIFKEKLMEEYTREMEKRPGFLSVFALHST